MATADASPPSNRWWHRLAGPLGAGGLAAVAVAVAVGVLAGWFDSLDVLHGLPLWVPVGLAVASLTASLAGRPVTWWRTWGVGVVAATTVVVATAHWWVRHSGLVLDRYPTRFVVFVWLAVAAIGVAVTGWWSGPAAVRAVRVLAAPLSVLSAFLLINSYYGYWPTVGALLNQPVAGELSKQAFARLLHPAATASRAAAHDLLALQRKATTVIRRAALPVAPLPASVPVPAGRYGPVDIPGTAVGFKAAQAYLWLPPDFATVAHADLPVMIMLPGWPGNVQDWTRAGGVTATADAWARTHGGQAPIMLFIDENGALGHDTECVNSVAGQAESYLTYSVPLWLERTLGVVPSPDRWSLVGYSEGGTCAVTLALRHPGLYGRFADIAGDWAPNAWGGPKVTLRVLFGGSTRTEAMHTPALLMKWNRYPGMDGWFAAGTSDRLSLVARRLAAEAARTGMQVQSYYGPGAHTWIFAEQAFRHIYPGLVGALSGSAPGRPAT